MTVNAVIKAFTSATGRVIVFCDTKSDCDELVGPHTSPSHLALTPREMPRATDPSQTPTPTPQQPQP